MFGFEEHREVGPVTFRTCSTSRAINGFTSFHRRQSWWFHYISGISFNRKGDSSLKLGGGFKFLEFSPQNLGEEPSLTSINFQRGLVRPPTRTRWKKPDLFFELRPSQWRHGTCNVEKLSLWINGTGKDLHDAIGETNVSRWLALAIIHSFYSSNVGDDWNVESASNGFFCLTKTFKPPPTHHQLTIYKKHREKPQFSYIFWSFFLDSPVNLKTSRDFPFFLVPESLHRLSYSEVGDFSAGVGYIGAIDHLPKATACFSGVAWWSWWVFETHQGKAWLTKQ